MKKKIFTLIVAVISFTGIWAQEAFLGEIRMFAGNYAPQGWMLCQGQTLNILQNQALYSIIGTTYGGNGTTTFMLPNLCGRVPLGMGQGTGLTLRLLGQSGGEEKTTLNAAQLPPHTQPLYASSTTGTTNTPASNVALATLPNAGLNAVKPYAAPSIPAVPLSAASIGTNISSAQAHNNMMPYTTINYIICITGIYPTRD